MLKIAFRLLGLSVANSFCFCYKSFCEWLMRTINYLINVYSITFWGLYYWFVHGFFVFWVHYWQCGHMTLVTKKFTTRLSWKPKPNRKPRFFLENLPKPTERKHFETVTTLFYSGSWCQQVSKVWSTDTGKGLKFILHTCTFDWIAQNKAQIRSALLSHLICQTKLIWWPDKNWKVVIMASL